MSGLPSSLLIVRQRTTALQGRQRCKRPSETGAPEWVHPLLPHPSRQRKHPPQASQLPRIVHEDRRVVACLVVHARRRLALFAVLIRSVGSPGDLMVGDVRLMLS